MQLDLFNPQRRNSTINMKEYKHNVPMQMWCEDDKPATKLLMKGRAAVSDSELLSLIIAKDSSGFSSLNAARKILFSCSDNLGEMARLSVTDLVREGNITLAQATRIITAFEIGRRRNSSEVSHKEKIASSRVAFEIFKSCMFDKPYEEFWILLLNSSNRMIGKFRISEGGISGTVVDPKKIFKIALENHATGIILGITIRRGTLIQAKQTSG
jgi:DNA repair protein RadC